MNYPEGRYECTDGVYEWDMSDEDTIGVRTTSVVIGQVEYAGVASLQRQVSGWRALAGDVYFRRVEGSQAPTLNASEKFRDRVAEIANAVDTEKRRAEARIARLEDQKNELAGTIVRLREEIEEHEDDLEAIGIELADHLAEIKALA